ncbi:hypothetical protein JEZ13_10765 [bacterium]|nr:hypothetical protein [bacterium]
MKVYVNFKQKNIIILHLLSIILIMFSSGCSDKTTPINNSNSETGLIPISISLTPLQELEVTVTEAIARVSKDNEEFSQSLTLTEDSATGSISGLNPGVWHLEVELFSGTYIIAFGETDVEVFPGQTSLVHLTLTINDITGSIEIIVDWEITEPIPQRVLFLGNSYTYYNDGLDQMFKNVVESTDENLRIEVQAITGGGLTLENHFNNPTTQATILNGNWDLVVLQEQSQMPILDTATFLTYAAKLDSLIDLSGAQTCFFMTWAREYDQTQIAGLSSAYLQAGEELDADVVPVGQLFNYVFEDNSEISLYVSDGSHPSWQGTYLASLCFFQSLIQANAQDVTYLPDALTTQEADYLKETVNLWYSNWSQ